jgi:NADH:ubiquinone oxidoreductase subunit F (NADH-binding)
MRALSLQPAALASATATLARGRAGASREAVQQLWRWAGDIEGRGACRHPDGAVRLLRSALTVFADDVDRHAAARPCHGTSESVIAVPPRHEVR